MKKQVTFNSTITVHYDPEDLADDLKEYRKSDVLQRQMDALRMKNLLSPILTLTHRSKIWKSLSANESICDVQVYSVSNDVNTKLEGNDLNFFSKIFTNIIIFLTIFLVSASHLSSS